MTPERPHSVPRVHPPALILILAATVALATTGGAGAVTPVAVIAQDGDFPTGGNGGEVNTLNAPFTDGNGVPGFTGAVTGEVSSNFVWYATGITWLNISALPDHTLTGAESTMGVGTSGQFVYSPSIDGDDGVWSQNGLLAVEATQAPGFPPGVNSTFHSRPQMSDGGQAHWVAGFNDAGGTTTLGRVLYTSSDATPGNTVVVLRSDDMIGGFPIDRPSGVDFDYNFSGDNTHLITVLQLDTGSTVNDDHVYVDGTLVAREASPDGDGDNWDNFDNVSINNSGHYLFSGDTDGATASDEFIAYDGAIALREGDTVGGVVLTTVATVQALSINDLGQAVHFWNAGGERLFYAFDAADLRGSSVQILAVGDSVDVDGDGTPDATVTDFNGSQGIGPSLDLDEDGRLLIEVDLNYGAGDLEAEIALDLPAKLVINEVDYDQGVTDAEEFVEIYNASGGPVNLDPYSIELVDGTGGGASVYQTIDLPDVTLAAGDFYVVCGDAAMVPNCDLDVSPDTDLIQDGSPDAVGLRFHDALIDAVSYDGDTGLPYREGTGTGVVVDVGRGAPHARLRAPSLVDGTASLEGAVDEGAVAAVLPELVRRLVVGDEEIGPAIAIEIGGNDAEAVAESGAQTCRRGDVGDAQAARRILPFVAQQGVGSGRRVAQRAAVVRSAGGVLAGEVGGERPDHVVGDEEVEVAVGVGVEEGGAGAPPRVAGARFLGDVGKEHPAGLGAVVAQQGVATDVGDVEVGIAVAVDVADGNPHAVAAVVAAGACRDVFEAAVAAVAPQLVAGLRRAAVETAALHQVEVEIAVAVEVEERAAAPHDLREEEAFAVPRLVGESGQLLRGHRLEPGAGRLAGGPGWGSGARRQQGEQGARQPEHRPGPAARHSLRTAARELGETRPRRRHGGRLGPALDVRQGVRRLLQPAEVELGVGAPEERREVSGVCLEGFVEGVPCLRRPTGVAQQGAGEHQGPRIAGVELPGATQLRHRFVATLQGGEKRAAAGVGGGGAGVERHRPISVCEDRTEVDGLVLGQDQRHLDQVEPGEQVVGVLGDRFLEGGQGRRRIAAAQAALRQHVETPHLGLPLPQRFEERQGGLAVAALQERLCPGAQRRHSDPERCERACGGIWKARLGDRGGSGLTGLPLGSGEQVRGVVGVRPGFERRCPYRRDRRVRSTAAQVEPGRGDGELGIGRGEGRCCGDHPLRLVELAGVDQPGRQAGAHRWRPAVRRRPAERLDRGGEVTLPLATHGEAKPDVGCRGAAFDELLVGVDRRPPEPVRFVDHRQVQASSVVARRRLDGGNRRLDLLRHLWVDPVEPLGTRCRRAAPRPQPPARDAGRDAGEHQPQRPPASSRRASPPAAGTACVVPLFHGPLSPAGRRVSRAGCAATVAPVRRSALGRGRRDGPLRGPLPVAATRRSLHLDACKPFTGESIQEQWRVCAAECARKAVLPTWPDAPSGCRIRRALESEAAFWSVEERMRHSGGPR